MSDQPIDPDLPISSADEIGDLRNSTLTLLRRILAGNGYRFDEIDIRQDKNTDFTLKGLVEFKLAVNQNTQRRPGQTNGNENKVFQDRHQYTHYLSTATQTFEAQPGWLEDVQTAVQGQLSQLWGSNAARWPLPRLTQTVALTEVCEQCKGQRWEVCRTCHGQRERSCELCYERGRINCTTCRGTGSDPSSQGGRACPQCNGLRTLPCPQCNSRGRIVCTHCQGHGQTQCTLCNGQGYFTELTTLTVNAVSSFRAGSFIPQPNGNVVDALNDVGLDKLDKMGIALVSPAPTPPEMDVPAIALDARFPYGQFTLQLKDEIVVVESLGYKPILVSFPPLLDDRLKQITRSLDLTTLPKFCRQFRLLRELSEALAAGVKPRVFFARRYPYGVSPDVAFMLAGQLRRLFSTVTVKPRLIAAGGSIALSSGAIFAWLYNPRPEFIPANVPTWAMDIGLIAIFALIPWISVEIAGRRALKTIIAPNKKISATAGSIGWGASLAVIVIALLLLWWPDLRPEWVYALLG